MPTTPDPIPRHVVESWHLADSATAHRMNQLLADDVVQQAGAAQRAAITEEFSFQQAEGQAMQRLRDQGVIPQKGANPIHDLNLQVGDSYAARAARTRAARLQNQAVARNAPITTPKTSASAQARIRLPTSLQLPTGAQLAQRARSLAPAVGRSIATGAGQTALAESTAFLLNLSDDLNQSIGEQLPDNIEPYWDGIAGPNGIIERAITPPNVAALREGVRLRGDLDRILNGVPARSELGGIAQQLACSIFGIGCPTATEGVPNLGSPGVAPPFYGGQSAVFYSVSTRTDTTDINGYESIGGIDVRQVLGPIRGMGKFPVDTPEGHRTEVRLLHAPTFDRPNGETYLGSYLTSAFQSISPLILSISRVDGQPDTGGNPAPSPDAGSRPATAPPLANRRIPPPANAPTLPSTGVPNPATTPIAPTPTAPPDTGVEDPLAPLRDIDPLAGLLPFLGAIPFMIPTSGKGFNPSGAQQPGQAPTLPPTATGDIPTPTCRYDSSNIAGRVDRTNLAVQGVQTFMEYQVMQKLDRIDAKLGPQIPGGGIGNFIKKMWDFLAIDRILSILTYITVLHNAYMLSNSIGQTLFGIFGQALELIGLNDAEGNPFDVGKVFSEWTEDFFKGLFGGETVDGIKAGWTKYNRIYQAATNILNSMQSMISSLGEILEVVANYTGRIGNALKRSGAVVGNSFNWMNDNMNYTNNKFFRFMQRVQDSLEIVENVVSEMVSVKEELAELTEQSEAIKKEILTEEGKVKAEEGVKIGKEKNYDLRIIPSDEVKAEVND